MFILNWFTGMLEWLGLKHKKGKIVFLGLDNAGKSTLMHMLKDARLAQLAPTLHPSHEELTVGKIRFTAHDLGGHQMARKLWREYSTGVDAIVFLIDSADRDRLQEAKRELDSLLTDDTLSHIPILLLGNKIDVPSACGESELRGELGLHNLTTGKGKTTGMRPVEIFMCSVLNKAGYGEGFRWLAQYL